MSIRLGLWHHSFFFFILALFSVLVLEELWAFEPPAETGLVNVVTAYGADPADGADDTAAVQRAISENMRKRTLFPQPDLQHQQQPPL
ncbi:MAG: hypothetical protein HC904_08895 [Blastochloris sp.]|nr:hypothetical protein [Blastochloris sp.]